MFKSFKYRLNPTKTQKVLLDKHIGCARFIYNLGLETKTTAYAGHGVNLSNFDLIKQLPDLKSEFEWLCEINSQTLQQSLINLDIAYKIFFKGASNFPRFKRKKSGGSFSVPQNVTLDQKNKLLIIPKFRKKNAIKINLHREIKESYTIKSCVISRTPTGKYFASILVETNTVCPKKKKIKPETTVGIDLGIKTFLVSSNGKELGNEKHLRKAMSKLKYLQSRYSKFKGKRSKQKLVLLYEKVANKRRDFLHKASSEIVNNHDNIAIEDLNIQGMLKNHCLAQAISDVSWGMFVEMLEYKAEWCGKNILRIGRFDPSSKVCNCCGHINKELTLTDRKWTCINCNTTLDRDLNAALNIKNFALKKYLSGEHRLKNQDELPTLVGVKTLEATTLKSCRSSQ